MFKLEITNKFGQSFTNTGTLEQLELWKQTQIANNSWGKPERIAIKKGQVGAVDYDDADIVEEFVSEDSPFIISVKLKAEYEFIGPIDLSKDAENIEAKKVDQYRYDVDSGNEIILKIGAMIAGSENEELFFLNYEEHFKMLEFFLQRGRLSYVRNAIDAVKNTIPIFTLAQAEKVIALLDEKIAQRPTL